jgi:hypothetical protein
MPPDLSGGPSLGRSLASIGVGLLPGVGTAQSLLELISGRDYIAGEKTSRWLAAAGLFAGLVPGGKGLLKALSKADDIADLAKVGRAGDETFEILDGVKRAKASDDLGKSTISAEIDVGGRTVGKVDIPIENLRSPRPEIPTAGTGLERLQRAYRDVAGGTTRPIRVTPGIRGIPIRDVQIR